MLATLPAGSVARASRGQDWARSFLATTSALTTFGGAEPAGAAELAVLLLLLWVLVGLVVGALQAMHASEAARLLEAEGYDADTVARVRDLVQKKGLGRDPEVQALEDALCLVFLETQFGDVAARLAPEKLADVLRKTLRKMSAAGRAQVADLPLAPADRELLESLMGD